MQSWNRNRALNKLELGFKQIPSFNCSSFKEKEKITIKGRFDNYFYNFFLSEKSFLFFIFKLQVKIIFQEFVLKI